VIQAFQSRQFLLFLLTGGVAATANFSSRIAYSLWLDYSAAIGLAYLTGMIVAFVLARLFVFKDARQSLYYSAMFFVLVNFLAVLQTWLISLGLAYYLLPQVGIESFREEIAHAVGVVVPVFTSYIGHKYLSFR
jgi:putative flippase GtrA